MKPYDETTGLERGFRNAILAALFVVLILALPFLMLAETVCDCMLDRKRSRKP